MRILGTFRDLDDPDQFVWLRGFDDLASRAPALEAFYSGSVWKAHSAAANATMVDVDNVLLLRPADGRPGPRARPGAASPGWRARARRGALAVTISAEATECRRGDALARFVTEHAQERLPGAAGAGGRRRRRVAAAVELRASAGRVETLRLRPTPRSLLP